jgi:GT2 family glycosyltransferase
MGPVNNSTGFNPFQNNMVDTPLDVSIIIISYNTREMTLACIESIFDETRRHAFEIIVLDNNSQDGSVDAIRSRFPQVRLIATSDNLGFAGGNNAAAAEARGARLLLLNPDTVVLDGAIDTLLDYADCTPDARVWGGRAIFPDGSINASCSNDMTLWSSTCRALGLTWLFPGSKFFNPESIHMWDDLSKDRSVDIVVGCFLMIDKLLWVRLGGFNPIFFMYGDEVDLCLRARKLGASPRITPKATIIHYGGGSEPSSEDKLVKVLKGRATVMREHWLPAAAVLGRWILLVTAALRALGCKVLSPPERKGAGRDRQSGVWPGVFRRRNEWCAGWKPSKSAEL